MITVDTAALSAAADRIARNYLGAAKEGVAETTRELERELEDLTKAAVPGKLHKAWASSVFPRGKEIARDPVGTVFVSGGLRSRGAMTFWTQPGRIVGRGGQWLAIPTAAAGSRGRARNLTPGDWERRTGQRLRFVYRGGNRSALLVADNATLNGRTGVARPITRARTAADLRRGFQRGTATVVIFVLIPSVAFGNKVALQPAIARAQGRLGANVSARLASISG